ncbi:ABC transporter ATP-binding protein [Tessaracoccus flavus]|uniref:Spermidine/putrescine import ATP-binding protein PotA n=1 Tax=Tessaracoccus flavus TaxID=1610493 RepID=A0A1Q2CEF9_9ACTN|nr:ABC transporter ATP-binding protein [Tessaracoccus flavus]AQP44488.1 polyamine ABC transporter ATP-binding protein [Tessaracoccus flavus]SDY70950.1 iron(III) transport system ATP-binding protein [Tessaracoccus flavus]
MTDLAAADKLLEGTPTDTVGRLQLRGLTKEFGNGPEKVTAVDAIDLDIEPGEFITLLGPSGCGKTTTLRMIAGFEDPSGGEVVLDGRNMIDIPPNKRPMAMVFQSYALFPHLKVRDNVGYGLKLRRLPATQLNEEVDLALESMNLQQYANRAPNQLSGGQQQRVALARAMVMKPKVLLFDEPLSNLDAKLREQMRLEIRRLQRHLGITSVYVTHDQSEAMSMSDRIVVMNKGQVEQAAPPETIYRHPASVFVADFIGRANFLDVRVISHDGDGRATVEVLGQRVQVPAHPDAASAKDVVLLVRPESLRLVSVGSHGAGDLDGHEGRVVTSVFFGDTVEYEVETEHGKMAAVVADPNVADIHPEGADVEVRFNAERAWLLPRDS